ncbi:MAG TPA: transglycosylase SLT domain-containing protein [Ramlibacter sp.]|nr:transglycosylase SLT domain-containing protein [Ramlibacter sp.]
MIRYFQFGALALSLWLAGCASAPPGVGAPAGSVSSSPSMAPQSTDARVPNDESRSRSPSAVSSAPLTPIAAMEASSLGVTTLEAPPDLWSRIRTGFAMPTIDGELVRQHEQWYATRPDYMQRMTERSSKYLFHIVEELERRNMPSELALLPFIESAFNPQAVSSARAAGMWQFMPATGTDFELRQNVFRDDRRDVLASTRAALDYLQKLHGMFGDWHLALAAYNWGQGNVSRAIARNQKAGLGTSYTEISMPNETRSYVPKLQAVKNIVMRPEQFRAELPLIENHPYFDTVQVTRDIDVKLAAQLADIHVDDFKALNPSMNRPVILAAGTPQILLPWDNAKVFKRNFEGYTAGQYATWTAWTAPATMSAGEAARRVGMSEADFRSINNIPPRMLIRAGSVVLAPRGAHNGQDVSVHVADNAQISFSPEIVMRRTTVKAGKRDTVASIAARYRVRPSDVAEWNHTSSATSAFKAGQAVVLHLPTRAVAKRGGVRAGARATARATPRRATVRAAARSTPRATVTAKSRGSKAVVKAVATR